MRRIVQRIHLRLGDFWWYSLLLFFALRCGDVINAFVGLWLVPKFVPQSELGAVLAITNFASVFGLPITILVTVYTKFLNRYMALGQAGKVKSLLQWFIGASIVFVLVSSLLSVILLPLFFERIRIVSGSLGLLIVFSGIIGAVTPVFSNALQGLKKFNALTVQNFLSAPIRLVTMLVAIPFRALSGYMLGQVAAPLFTICWAGFSLRKELRSEVKPVLFWKEDGRRLLKYLACVAVWFLTGGPYAALFTMIVRQRLPEAESAAYYMISRFAELGTYAGVTMMVVMFPLVSEAHTKGKPTEGILRNANIATLAFGFLITLVFFFFGGFILELLPTSAPYSRFSYDMALLCASLVLGQIWSNYTNHEIAKERFTFLWYGVPLTILHTMVLVCFTGYSFFYGIFPKSIVDWMGSINLATLRNILWLQLYVAVVRVLFVGVESYSLRVTAANNHVNRGL